MPIGKNSIKRVANNGYSNVKTDAPDMENSTVLANPAPEVIEKMIPSSKKIAPKKSAPKKTVKKAEPVIAEPASVITKSTVYVNLGEDLPDYLL